MPLTEFACPACPEDKPGQINYTAGSITCSLNPAHRWTDTSEFAKLKPVKKFSVAPTIFPAQVGQAKITVQVPGGVEKALTEKWGDKLQATISGVLTMMAEGEYLMIPKSDLQRMKERLGKIPESSGELFGMIYALGMALEDAKAEAQAANQDVAAYAGLNKGSIVINLGDDYSLAVEKARSQEPPEPVKVFVEKSVRTGLANGWF